MIELYCFFLFLPCAVCLIALATIALKLRKLATDGWLMAAAAVMVLYFFSYAYTEFTWVYYAGKVLGIAILPLIYIWVRKAFRADDVRPTWRIWQRYNDSEWSARDKFLIRADIAVLVGVLTDIARQIVDRLMTDALIIDCVLALLQAAALYVFFAATIYASIIDNPAVNKETYRAVQQARLRKLRDDFERLMTEQRPYLKQGLTIEDVALMLATNRTYVSQMLHDDYGCSFPEYMLEKRLEYSKEYMREHPHEVQEEIAFQCGFASASGFNKRFREQFGQTPKEWMRADAKKA